MKRMIRMLAAVLVASALVVGIAPQRAGAAASYQKYVALGDSVAAGAGLPLVSDQGEDLLCARSTYAYPTMVAQQLGAPLTQLSCSGAKVDEGLYGKQKVGQTKLQPQLTRAFADGKPDLMTITIGANDARWADFVGACYVTTCGTKLDDTRAKVYLADLTLELHWSMYKINKLSKGTPPKVMLTGYYNPFAANKTCADTQGIEQKEVAWLSKQQTALNKVIERVASHYSFVTFVPVDFSGHELCTAEPWVQGVTAPAPIHPTVSGQRAIAEAIVHRL